MHSGGIFFEIFHNSNVGKIKIKTEQWFLSKSVLFSLKKEKLLRLETFTE